MTAILLKCAEVVFVMRRIVTLMVLAFLGFAAFPAVASERYEFSVVWQSTDGGRCKPFQFTLDRNGNSLKGSAPVDLGTVLNHDLRGTIDADGKFAAQGQALLTQHVSSGFMVTGVWLDGRGVAKWSAEDKECSGTWSARKI